MREILKKIIGKTVRRAMAPMSKAKLKRELIRNLNKTEIPYSFSEQDIALYVEEKFVSLPSIRENCLNNDDLFKRVEVGGIQIWWPRNISPQDLPWLYHEVFDPFSSNPSSYDHPAMEFSDANWILDGGAAEGFFSVFALKKSTAHVISVEPLPQMRVPLAKTLIIYGPADKITILTAALGEQSGFCEVMQDSAHICDTKVSVIDSTNTTNKHTVPVITIDRIMIQYNLKGPGIIKMDIEGSEMNALRGATVILKELKPKLVVAVYHNLNNANECAAIIMKANPAYNIEFRGMYGYFDPPRPYMLFAY